MPHTWLLFFCCFLRVVGARKAHGIICFRFPTPPPASTYTLSRPPFCTTRRFPHIMPPELASSLASQVARGEVLQWDAHAHPEHQHPPLFGTPGTSHRSGHWLGGPSPGTSANNGMPRAAGMFGSSTSLSSLQGQGRGGGPLGGPPPRPPYVPPPPLPVRTGSHPYAARMTAVGSGVGQYPGPPSRAPSGGTSDVSMSPSPATAMANELRASPQEATMHRSVGSVGAPRVPVRDRRTHGGDGRVFRILSAGNLQSLAGESIDE